MEFYLSIPDSDKALDGFLKALYSEGVFVEWRRVRDERGLCSESEMVRWMLEGGLVAFIRDRRERQPSEHNELIAQLLSTQSVSQSEDVTASFFEDRAVETCSNFLRALYGYDIFTRWKKLKQELNMTVESLFIQLLLKYLRWWQNSEDECVSNRASPVTEKVADEDYQPHSPESNDSSDMGAENMTSAGHINSATEDPNTAEQPEETEFTCSRLNCSFSCNTRFKLYTHEDDHVNAAVRCHHFQCDRCRFKSDDKRSFIRHYYRMHPEIRVLSAPAASSTPPDATHCQICERCGYSSVHRGRFTSHMRLHNGKLNVCAEPGCGYQSRDLHTFRVHKMIHTGERPNKCPHCDYRTRGPLRRHVQVFHRGDRLYHCDQCSFRCLTKVRLVAHTLVHSEASDRTFPCAHCVYRARTRHTLNKHKRMYHARKLAECANCGFRAMSRMELEEHRVSSEGCVAERCVHCAETFPSASTLARHVSAQHPDTRPICELCAHRAPSKAGLRLHWREEHGHVIRARTGCWGDEKAWRRYECSACMFACDCGQEMHGHECTRASNVMHYPCDQCDYITTVKQELATHKATGHARGRNRGGKTGLAPDVDSRSSALHQCEVCSRVLPTLRQLKTHERLEHSEGTPGKPFTCKECGFICETRWRLHVHRRENHEPAADVKPPERKYECSVCGLGFSRKGNIVRHFKLNRCRRLGSEERVRLRAGKLVLHIQGPEEKPAPRKNFQCLLCGHGFVKRLGVWKHLKYNHCRKLSRAQSERVAAKNWYAFMTTI